MLNWTQADLEKRSKVSRATIKRIEAEDGIISKATTANIARIVEVMKERGIRFLSEENGALGVFLDRPDEAKAKKKKKRASDGDVSPDE